MAGKMWIEDVSPKTGDDVVDHFGDSSLAHWLILNFLQHTELSGDCYKHLKCLPVRYVL